VIESVVEARPISVVVVELGWQGDRTFTNVVSVVTHGAARSSAQAVIDRLVMPVKEP
jgi:hypothetical protein